MKKQKMVKKFYVKVKYIDGALTIGTFCGVMCTGMFACKRIGDLVGNPVLADLLARVIGLLTVNEGLKLAGLVHKKFKNSKFYMEQKQYEDILAKAEANGWTLVKGTYTVEDWDAAA